MTSDHFNIDSYRKAFLVSAAILLVFGLIMVYSSSYLYSKETFGSSITLVGKQAIFALLGSLFAFILSKSKFEFWYKHSYKWQVFITILLALTFIGGVGLTFKGSNRWLSIYGLNVQPAEFLKYTTIFVSTKYFYEFYSLDIKERIKKFLIIIAPLLMVILQPDFGTFSICIASVAFACFLSDFSRKWFYGLASFTFVGLIAVLFSASYRVQRMLAFLDPWEDPKNTGFQIIQSYLAFANGSIFGQGLGNSNEKLFYLPEAYNDFIFSVIGEELGFIGVIFTVSLFLVFIYSGLKIALYKHSEKSQRLMISIVFIIGLQAYLNMGVVLGLLPTKGLNLPFISYGGSSLISNLIALGMFFSALSSSDDPEKNEDLKQIEYNSFGYGIKNQFSPVVSRERNTF